MKLRPFKIKVKFLNIVYKLDLLNKMKIYLVQYIIILKPAHKNLKLLVYKVITYKGQEKNKQLVKKIIDYKEYINSIQYKVLQESYLKIIQELKINLGNAKKRI